MNKLSELLSSKTFLIVVSFIGLYLISAGVSWGAFTYLSDSPSVSLRLEGLEKARSELDGLPKTEECPINGGMFTEIEREIWEERRPITAIIENHHDSRPLEGLHRADVVYEAVAEGGITRHLAVFYCGVSAEDVRIAPVRSARVHFVSWAAEYGDAPIFVHVGGANRICGECYRGLKPTSQVSPEVDAVGALIDLGWRVPKGNDFDTTYDSGFPVFYRDPERLGHPIASEHTMVSTTDAIFEEADKRGYAYEDSDGNAWDESFVSWKFEDENPSSSPTADKISFEFWGNWPEYEVVWVYDKSTNRYLRENGGEKAVDLSSGIQFSAKNVVVQFVDERGPVDSEKHMFYKTIDTGSALVFNNGNVIEGTWEKEKLTGRTIFYDEDGSEIKFVRGTVWIEGVPTGNEVDF